MDKQPVWKIVGQLGDVNPTEHGGLWVFIDETGAYAPEAELLQIDDETRRGIVYRFILEDCTFANGILSDNRFHPSHPAWFADSLEKIASYVGESTEALRGLLLSNDPLHRARAWEAIGSYHGFENLDSYPLEMSRTELKARYRLKKYRFPQSKET